MQKLYFIILILISTSLSQDFDFNHDGQIRQYILYQPDTIQDNAPLIFALHGYGGGPNWMINNTGLNDIAEENGFAVCYPKGTTDSWNNRFWNVGYDFHEDIDIDDVDFISSLAIYLQSEYSYTPEKTFVTGMSNGGDMSYMLACQTDDIFKAIAPVAGCMMENIYNTCNPSPIPIFEIHGTDDNITLWNGDMQNNDGWGSYLSTLAGIDYWVEKNECQSSENIEGPNSKYR
jgi:polyhydroxybutyrate depolymerase